MDFIDFVDFLGFIDWSGIESRPRGARPEDSRIHIRCSEGNQAQ